MTPQEKQRLMTNTASMIKNADGRTKEKMLLYFWNTVTWTKLKQFEKAVNNDEL